METSINEAFFVEGAKVAWKKGVEERYEIAKTDGVLQTREGPQKYKSGYYILTGPEGEQYSMPPTTFRKLKDDQGGSKAVPKKIPKLVKLAEGDGRVHTSWGEVLEFRAKKDYIVRHGKGDYGIVKREIFDKTYEFEGKSPSQTAPAREIKPLFRPGGSGLINQSKGRAQTR